MNPVKQKSKLKICYRTGNRHLKILQQYIIGQKNRKALIPRTAVIGTSIGASLAFYAVYDLSAKVIIGISVGKGPFEAFTGLNELRMAMAVRKIKNVLLIYGDKDGDYPNDGKYLYNSFLDDPRDIISFDSDKHGKDLIKQFPEINTSILNWLRKYL